MSLLEITKKHPLDLDYEADTRYVWPRRWVAVTELVEQLQAKNERYEAVIEKCIKAMKGSNCLELEWLKEALKK